MRTVISMPALATKGVVMYWTTIHSTAQLSHSGEVLDMHNSLSTLHRRYIPITTIITVKFAQDSFNTERLYSAQQNLSAPEPLLLDNIKAMQL